MKNIRINGDRKVNVLQSGSREASSEESDEETKQCCGFEDVQQKKECKAETDGLLQITVKKSVKYFCKTSHLFRYLLLFYCVQGKKNKRKRDKEVERESSKE